MSQWPFDNLPLWAMLLDLAAHLAFGIGIGLLYFRTVGWSARQFAAGGSAAVALAFTLGRLLVLGCLLVLASREGPLPLLLLALGVLLARPFVLRSRRGRA